MANELKIIPLGGVGEIGMNLMVLEYDDDIVLVDCGVLFPDLYWLGLELVLPDFTYLIENKERVRGLVITHGHEDHIGAIPFLLKQIDLPKIYCSRFASRLIEEKCIEHGVKEKLHIQTVKAGDHQSLGRFDFEFIHVTHSTLETFALAIRTPLGLIVHSGDFKFDEEPYDGPSSDKKRLEALGAENPILLLSDSTNSERCGHSESESSITEDLSGLITNAPEAVVVALFASNIHRVHQLMDIAKETNRKVFLSGRSMERYVNIAIEEGFLSADLSLLRPLEALQDYPRNQILVLSTGSQGEARSSLLRLAKNENRWLQIKPNDVVILSSRNIPGNERAINFVINQLCKLGATVFYDELENVHVSGHAYQEEQLELLELVKPKYFIPVHGEYRHLVAHVKTANKSNFVSDKSFLIENGQVWSFDGEIAKVLEETVVTGRQWFFRENISDMEDEALKERRSAAKNGIISVICLVKRRGTELVQTPTVKLSGFLGSKKRVKELTETIQTETERTFNGWYAENPDGFTREQAVGFSARRVFRKVYDLKPLVIVNFISV